ncbi:two-component system sensor histidine kinase NtrB [Metabacillus idriensis]|uniref:two-component system sensor histidine kinase NtrB n=1 Tax=Metabacillus idriensis TaxID=324768 RepID=UPI001CD4050B|nr:ATP-binding protein [Metabacillus idriensis]
MKMENELEVLRKENQLLKELITQWPSAFTYVNPELELAVCKKKSDMPPSILKMTSTQLTAHTNQRLYLSSSENESFHHTEAFLSDIFDLVAHHVVFIDEAGIVTLCNLQAAKDHGVNRDEIIGKHLRKLVNIPDEQLLTLETARTGIEFVDREVLDKNYGILNTRILWNTDGSIKRVIGTFYFLNAIKEAEKQAIAGRIAAGIAHEIRNPLTTVRGFLQVLQASADAETKNLFQTILIPEIDRANKIISDFLSIAKPAEIRSEHFEVKEFLMNHLGRILESESLLYSIEFHIKIDPSAEGTYILGNKDELLQVFLNLFQNSFQAKNTDPLRIHIICMRQENRLQISFSDNGRGIIPSALNHIFDPFFSTKDSGTGLGLSVSKKIVENHKGTMTASSDENGTIFYLDFPVRENRI